MKKNQILIINPLTTIFVLLSVFNTACLRKKEKKTVPISKFIRVDTLYNENGKIELIKSTLNNKLHGKQKKYYENGKICLEMNYYEGIIVLSSTQYYKSGKPAFYVVRDADRKPFFSINYDTKGVITDFKGCILNTEYGINSRADTLKLNNSYLLRFLYAEPPQFKFSIDSLLLRTSDGCTPFKNYTVEKEVGAIFFDFIPNLKGFNQFTFHCSLVDKRGKHSFKQKLHVILISD